MVIRAHIHIEQKLGELIARLTPYPEQLRPMELDYFRQVHLVFALELKEEFVAHPVPWTQVCLTRRA